VGGRVGLAYGSVSVLKAASTIAIRYSLVRQQFGPPGQEEIAILVSLTVILALASIERSDIVDTTLDC
jgi:hypothetical protein